MIQEELNNILADHARWIVDRSTGKRANLTGADLERANLTWANLREADLREADLTGADLDFSSWPLWCGSLNVRIDSRISRQLIYHFLKVMPAEDKKEFLDNPYKYANGFHRTEECGLLEEIC